MQAYPLPLYRLQLQCYKGVINTPTKILYKYIGKIQKKINLSFCSLAHREGPAGTEIRPPSLHHRKLPIPLPLGPENPSPTGPTPRTTRSPDRSAQRNQTPQRLLEEGRCPAVKELHARQPPDGGKQKQKKKLLPL